MLFQSSISLIWIMPSLIILWNFFKKPNGTTIPAGLAQRQFRQCWLNQLDSDRQPWIVEAIRSQIYTIYSPKKGSVTYRHQEDRLDDRWREACRQTISILPLDWEIWNWLRHTRTTICRPDVGSRAGLRPPLTNKKSKNRKFKRYYIYYYNLNYIM